VCAHGPMVHVEREHDAHRHAKHSCSTVPALAHAQTGGSRGSTAEPGTDQCKQRRLSAPRTSVDCGVQTSSGAEAAFTTADTAAVAFLSNAKHDCLQSVQEVAEEPSRPQFCAAAVQTSWTAAPEGHDLMGPPASRPSSPAPPLKQAASEQSSPDQRGAASTSDAKDKQRVALDSRRTSPIPQQACTPEQRELEQLLCHSSPSTAPVSPERERRARQGAAPEGSSAGRQRSPPHSAAAQDVASQPGPQCREGGNTQHVVSGALPGPIVHAQLPGQDLTVVSVPAAAEPEDALAPASMEQAQQVLHQALQLRRLADNAIGDITVSVLHSSADLERRVEQLDAASPQSEGALVKRMFWVQLSSNRRLDFSVARVPSRCLACMDRTGSEQISTCLCAECQQIVLTLEAPCDSDPALQTAADELTAFLTHLGCLSPTHPPTITLTSLAQPTAQNVNQHRSLRPQAAAGEPHFQQTAPQPHRQRRKRSAQTCTPGSCAAPARPHAARFELTTPQSADLDPLARALQALGPHLAVQAHHVGAHAGQPVARHVQGAGGLRADTGIPSRTRSGPQATLGGGVSHQASPLTRCAAPQMAPQAVGDRACTKPQSVSRQGQSAVAMHPSWEASQMRCLPQQPPASAAQLQTSPRAQSTSLGTLQQMSPTSQPGPQTRAAATASGPTPTAASPGRCRRRSSGSATRCATPSPRSQTASSPPRASCRPCPPPSAPPPSHLRPDPRHSSPAPAAQLQHHTHALNSAAQAQTSESSLQGFNSPASAPPQPPSCTRTLMPSFQRAAGTPAATQAQKAPCPPIAGLSQKALPCPHQNSACHLCSGSAAGAPRMQEVPQGQRAAQPVSLTARERPACPANPSAEQHPQTEPTRAICPDEESTVCSASASGAAPISDPAPRSSGNPDCLAASRVASMPHGLQQTARAHMPCAQHNPFASSLPLPSCTDPHPQRAPAQQPQLHSDPAPAPQATFGLAAQAELQSCPQPAGLSQYPACPPLSSPRPCMLPIPALVGPRQQRRVHPALATGAPHREGSALPQVASNPHLYSSPCQSMLLAPAVLPVPETGIQGQMLQAARPPALDTMPVEEKHLACASAAPLLGLRPAVPLQMHHLHQGKACSSQHSQPAGPAQASAGAQGHSHESTRSTASCPPRSCSPQPPSRDAINCSASGRSEEAQPHASAVLSSAAPQACTIPGTAQPGQEACGPFPNVGPSSFVTHPAEPGHGQVVGTTQVLSRIEATLSRVSQALGDLDASRGSDNGRQQALGLQRDELPAKLAPREDAETDAWSSGAHARGDPNAAPQESGHDGEPRPGGLEAADVWAWQPRSRQQSGGKHVPSLSVQRHK
jgi:hypothetical protein